MLMVHYLHHSHQTGCSDSGRPDPEVVDIANESSDLESTDPMQLRSSHAKQKKAAAKNDEIYDSVLGDSPGACLANLRVQTGTVCKYRLSTHTYTSITEVQNGHTQYKHRVQG